MLCVVRAFPSVGEAADHWYRTGTAEARAADAYPGPSLSLAFGESFTGGEVNVA